MGMEILKKGLTAFDGALERYFAKKWHWLITVPAVVVLLLALYFTFCFSTSLYGTSGYRDEQWRTAGRVVGGIVISVSLLYVLAEGYLRILTGRKAVWAFMVIASTFLTLWGFQNGLNLSHSHHDSGKLGSGNHWSIIYDIYSTGKIPPVNLHNQYYQPKLYHLVVAGLMKFNSFFVHIGDTPLASSYPAYTLSAYQSLEITRVYMLCLGIASFYAIYRIYKGLRLSDKKVAVCTAITILLPEFWFIQFFMNNDGMALTLSLIALALALEFVKTENIVVLAFCGLAQGLAMMTKINAALVAIPMAVAFLIVLGKKVFTKKRDGKAIGILIGKFALFAVIVIPIGLFVPVYYKVHYGMPIGYVMDLCPTLEQKRNYFMYIDPEFYNFFERCILFPCQDFFYSPFNYRNRHKVNGVYVNEYGVIDFNCWTAFFKTGFFDEWGDFINHNGYFATSLMIIGMYLEVFLVLFGVLAGIAYVARFFIKRQFKGEFTKQAVLVTLLITFVANYVYFVNRYPVGCSQNARYVMPLFIPLQAIVGSMLVDGQEFLLRRYARKTE